MMTNTLPFVSVIVPNYNSMTYIKNFCESLIAQDYEHFEVIIVDDGSNDGTLEYLEDITKQQSKIILIKTQTKQGLTKSRNIALERAKGAYIAFAETDMEFDRNWLKSAIIVLEADKGIGAISPKVLDIPRKDIIQTIGIKIIPQTGWVVCTGFGEKDTGQFTSQETSMGAVGTIARRSVIDSIQGFDEEMDRVDDIDLGWRIWIAGNRIISLPESICYHVTIKSWDIRKKSVTKIQQELALGRAIRMMLKNYEVQNIIKYFPQAVLALTARAILNLARGNSTSFVGLFHIFWWVVKTFPSTVKHRKYIQKNRKFSDERVFQGIMIRDTLPNVYKKYHVEAMQKLENFALTSTK